MCIEDISCHTVVGLLRLNVAATTGRTVVCTIHQPSIEIFEVNFLLNHLLEQNGRRKNLRINSACLMESQLLTGFS